MKQKMWAFIAEGEGIVATLLAGTAFPLVTATEAILPMMRDAAHKAAFDSGKVIKLHHFVLEKVEDI